MRISILQEDIAFGQPQENIRNMQNRIAEVVQSEKPDVILLPELWTTGYDLTRLDEISDEEGEQARAFAKEMSTTHGVHIIAGSVAKRTSRGVFNTMLTYDHNGNKVGEYSKVHLFRLMREEKYLLAGDKPGHFELQGTPCAGMICYDIRFPEWLRKHAAEGAEVFFVCAEWPAPRIHHWRTLLMSRAIENQAFIVACNRVGSDPENVFGGHSIVISPWGEIIAEAGDSQCTLTADIDVSQIAEIRRQIPVFEDRRPPLYE
ncbi:carbon-nitrogen family hydrolase [Bacillaceae bacterium SIJ1]|uniref:carbon-nitrogen family hydrolase n=1 Tax=Litoribacterium kuwaitense TaxID=1398745 RepID=UPI0013EB926E|nr:carbon-nitrogen family hydrolase [Litoribacterium kuwaitense]NGP46050.1 carbon-nitrogen family hydrolase [Litoribacterium kuwaitense]